MNNEPQEKNEGAHQPFPWTLNEYGSVIDARGNRVVLDGFSLSLGAGPHDVPQANRDAIVAAARPTTTEPEQQGEAREVASVTEIAAVIKEQLDKAEMWERLYKSDPQGRTDEAFWQGRARGLAETLDYVTRITLAATPSPGSEGEPSDTERLFYVFHHDDLRAGPGATFDQWRSAIDLRIARAALQQSKGDKG